MYTSCHFKINLVQITNFNKCDFNVAISEKEASKLVSEIFGKIVEWRMKEGLRGLFVS
jgi:hypothetical protein